MHYVATLALLSALGSTLSCASENRHGAGWRGPPPSSALQVPLPVVDGAVVAGGTGPAEDPDMKFFWDLQETPQVNRLLVDRLLSLLMKQSNNWETNEIPDYSAMPSKRQIRYHQCYFNPISCFRRRK